MDGQLVVVENPTSRIPPALPLAGDLRRGEPEDPPPRHGGHRAAQPLVTRTLSTQAASSSYRHANEAIIASQLVSLKDADVVTFARKLEYYLVTKCGTGRDVTTRLEGFRKVIDDLCEVQPGLVNFGHLIKRFMRDLVEKNAADRASHAEELDHVRIEVTHEKDRFYEDKLKALLSDKRTTAKRCVALEKQVEEMRIARDTDLNDAKRDLKESVGRLERSFADNSHMRGLITSIYKLSQAAEERALELESYIASLGLPVPGGQSSKVLALQEDKSAEAAHENDTHAMKRKLQEQLP
jgi:hypothetical protein